MSMLLNSAPILDYSDCVGPGAILESVTNVTIRNNSAARNAFINAPDRMNTTSCGEIRSLAMFNAHSRVMYCACGGTNSSPSRG